MPNCVFCEQINANATRECTRCGAPLPDGSSNQLDEITFRNRVLELLARGEKIQAVAAYRRQTGASLSAAVEFVDGLDSDQEFAIPCPIADVEREVGKFLERGEKIQAIKFYRERTGVGLKEAKDEVEALEARLGLVPEDVQVKSGCSAMILLFIIGAFWLSQRLV
jgi:ribosomal protein L7/L12